MTYVELKGRMGAVKQPREFTEYGYCIKAFPSCEEGKTFVHVEAEPLAALDRGREVLLISAPPEDPTIT